MAVDDDFMIVQKSQFDCLWQHCERCPYFGVQLRDLSDGGAVVIPHGRPSGEPSKKRKTLHELRPQEVSQPSQPLQQPQPPLPLQPPQEPGSPLPSRSSNGSKGKKPKRARAKGLRKRLYQKPRRNEAADWFLHNAPKATEWRKRQMVLGLNTVEQYEQAIRAFTDRANIIVERNQRQGDGHPEHELVDLAERFALLIEDSLTNAKLQKSFATFQALILLSYCGILRKRGVPQDTLDPIIQHIGGRECDRRRLLDSALWINGVIVSLVSHGWTIYRATELFFIGVFSKLFPCEVELILVSDAISITYLTHIHNNENSRLILEYLKKDEFVKHDYSDCLRPEYTIPGLIASLIDSCNMMAEKPSIDEIYAALGYSPDCVPKSVESIYEVHVATKSAPSKTAFFRSFRYKRDIVSGIEVYDRLHAALLQVHYHESRLPRIPLRDLA
ncbi:hypothetical protein MMC28_007024 [Mycoblastus sanguinarius]|nr:hypothetical protein [Mycoblastus sanguinarius]